MSAGSSNEKLVKTFRGVTKDSNWLIPNVIMLGGMPDAENVIRSTILPHSQAEQIAFGEKEPEEMSDLEGLIVLGNIRTFVCLQTSQELTGINHRAITKSVEIMKAEKRFRAQTAEVVDENQLMDEIITVFNIPYQPRALQIARQYGIDESEFKFIHFPITDGGVHDDATVMKFVKQLEEEVIELVPSIQGGKEGKSKRKGAMYIHCYAGRGRTGTIAGILLCGLSEIHPIFHPIIYEENPEQVKLDDPKTLEKLEKRPRLIPGEALMWLTKLLKTRVYGFGSSPENILQMRQVLKLGAKN